MMRERDELHHRPHRAAQVVELHLLLLRAVARSLAKCKAIQRAVNAPIIGEVDDLWICVREIDSVLVGMNMGKSTDNSAAAVAIHVRKVCERFRNTRRVENRVNGALVSVDGACVDICSADTIWDRCQGEVVDPLRSAAARTGAVPAILDTADRKSN